MFIFGWGRSSKTHELNPAQALVMSYGYLHLFWLFRVTFSRKFALATLTDQGWATRPVTQDELTAMGAPDLQVHWWWRFGLLLAIGAVVVLVVGVGLAQV